MLGYIIEATEAMNVMYHVPGTDRAASRGEANLA
jgi:hypothetical protein